MSKSAWQLATFGVVACGLVACRGSSAPRTPGSQPATTSADGKTERQIEHWTTQDEDTYIQRACRNIAAPEDASPCPALVSVGLDLPRCVQVFSALRGRAAADDDARQTLRQVVVELTTERSCDAIYLALNRVLQQHRGDSQADVRAGCRMRSDGALDLSSEDMLRRRGLGDRVFGETPSSADRPIEVCGLRGETQWLTRVTCADGSRPWGRSLEKAHGARQGSLAGNDRCDGVPAVIDHYVAPCPEKQYDIYFDMYHCGPGEELWRGVRSP